MSNPDLDAVLSELLRHGQVGRVDDTGRHLRVYFQGAKGRTFLVLSRSSSDVRSLRNAVAQCRRMLGVTGARAKSAHRGHRRPHHIAAPVKVPAELSTGGPGFSVLSQHPLMTDVMRLRADTAWRLFWSDICQSLFGAGSVADCVKGGME